MTRQTAEAAKPGWLGNDDNAACRHFFPALRVAMRRTTAGVAAYPKGGPAFGVSRDLTDRAPHRDAGRMGMGNPG